MTPNRMKLSTRLTLLAVALTLGACASKDPQRLATAATTPLNDLNLVKADIPAVLSQAQKQPYAVPEPLSCDLLGQEIHDLDAVLGPDLDAPATDDNPSLLSRGAEAAGNASVKVVQRSAEDVIPFRSWVRKLTGAERHARKLDAAITAGGVRRAFIKGVKVSKGCDAPATAADTPAKG